MAMITATIVIVPVAGQLSLAADDVLILDENAGTVMTGLVTDLDDDSFVLVTEDKKLTVDLDKIDTKDWPKDLLSDGMRVSVEGKFVNDELEATRVMKISDGDPDVAEEAADKAEEVD